MSAPPPPRSRKPCPTRAGVRACVAAILAALIAGCGTAPNNPYFATPSPTAPAPAIDTPTEVRLVPDAPAPVFGRDLIGTDSPVVTNSAPILLPPPVATRWGSGWVPLERWAAEPGVHLSARTPAPGNTSRYSITTRQGVCVLTLGTRLARWNGMNVWLGFAPQNIQGQPCVQAVDLEKILHPLAEPLPPRAGTRTLVLDPGHGGIDSGTRGAHGEFEKNFTLDWALRTERLLTNAGWRVILTRRSDLDVPLQERVAIADRARADLFISLHFNSVAPQTGPSGIETYCLTPSGAPSTLVRGYPDDPRAVFPNNSFDAANARLAFRLHHELVTQTRAADGGVKRARFMTVLRGQNRPAVLIEGGYLSNPSEVGQIASAKYRQKLAAAVAAALK